MDKARHFVEVFCTKIVFFIAVVMFGGLAFWAAEYTHEFPMDYAKEKVYASVDSLKGNLTVLLVVLLAAYILKRLVLGKRRAEGVREKQKKRVFWFLVADMAVTGILGIIWVTGSHIMPHADQYQVYLTAIEFSKGNFAEMAAYFDMYTQQYGLAFLYECILWIWESYHFVQYINVVFLLMILFFGYKISEALTDKPEVCFYTVVAMNAFLPLFLYVNFVYGEMGTMAMCLCSIWAVLRWLQTGKKRYACLAVVSMIFALMVRLNMIIVTIALAILLVLAAFGRKSWKPCILAVLLFVIPLGSIEAVKCSYELRSGNEIGGGMPVSAYIAMGMQESWQGAGAFNSFNQTIYRVEAGGDAELASQIGWKYVDAGVQTFAKDLPAAVAFYKTKLQEQWNVGSYGSLFMTAHFEAAPFAPVQSLYGGEMQEPALRWMDRYQFVIYFSVFVYCLYGLLCMKEMKGALAPMIVIGGMIFSLLWEAKSRYILPYVVMTLPCMAAGIQLCHVYIGTFGRKAVEYCRSIKEKEKWTKSQS